MMTSADELHAHLTAIARLESHPRTNAIAIEMHRQLALECVNDISAYLLISPTFAGV